MVRVPVVAFVRSPRGTAPRPLPPPDGQGACRGPAADPRGRGPGHLVRGAGRDARSEQQPVRGPVQRGHGAQGPAGQRPARARARPAAAGRLDVRPAARGEARPARRAPRAPGDRTARLPALGADRLPLPERVRHRADLATGGDPLGHRLRPVRRLRREGRRGAQPAVPRVGAAARRRPALLRDRPALVHRRAVAAERVRRAGADERRAVSSRRSGTRAAW